MSISITKLPKTKKCIRVINLNTCFNGKTISCNVSTQKNKTSKKTNTKKKKKKNKKKYLGKFMVYAYCPCSKCCGHSTGITASGKQAKQGRTIAVDTRVIPLGSIVYMKINGKLKKFIAEDAGSGIDGKKIDMFINSHQKCLKWGIKSIKVWVQKKK